MNPASKLGTCPTCGHRISTNARTCPNCGETEFLFFLRFSSEPCSLCVDETGGFRRDRPIVCEACNGSGLQKFEVYLDKRTNEEVKNFVWKGVH